jgi:hypothetical protein
MQKVAVALRIFLLYVVNFPENNSQYLVESSLNAAAPFWYSDYQILQFEMVLELANE